MGNTIEKERTPAQLLDWALLDDNASGTPWLETSQVDISSEIHCTFHIDLAHDNTATIASGNEVKLRVLGKSGATDEDWHEIVSLSGGTYCPNLLEISTGADTGDVSFGGDCTGLANASRGTNIFIRHATLANSWLTTLVDYTVTANAFWVLDAAPRDFTQTASDDKYYCATKAGYNGCDQWDIEIPEDYWAAKVTGHNLDDDHIYLMRVRYSMTEDYTSV